MGDIGGAFKLLLITSLIGLGAIAAWLVVGILWLLEHVRFA